MWTVFEKLDSEDKVLSLENTMYGSKQVAMGFWTELLKAHVQMNNERRIANLCLNYNCNYVGLIVWFNLIDDNLLVENKKSIEFWQKKIFKKNDCIDEGEVKEYAGFKIKWNKAERSLKMMQSIFIKHVENEFEIP